MNKHGLTPRRVGLWVWGSFTGLSLFVWQVLGTRQFTDGGLLIVWCLYSWNFHAYAFDKRMWPWQFVELHGQGKGQPGWRAFWFWFSVVMYSIILGAIAWAS